LSKPKHQDRNPIFLQTPTIFNIQSSDEVLRWYCSIKPLAVCTPRMWRLPALDPSLEDRRDGKIEMLNGCFRPIALDRDAAGSPRSF
jgi:hypothetical protein